jgi:hypothetical protein
MDTEDHVWIRDLCLVLTACEKKKLRRFLPVHQYNSAEWNPVKNHLEICLSVPLKKIGTDLLGPCGLASVSCPLKLGLSLGQDSSR